MKRKTFFIVMIPIFIVLFALMVGVGLNQTKKYNNKKHTYINDMGVQLTGKVIRKDTITKAMRPGTILCVDLSYSNTDSYFMLNKKYYIYLKIENNIASFVVPVEFSGLDSVAINMDNNGLQQFFLKGELLREYPVSLSYAYLNEEDLKSCFK